MVRSQLRATPGDEKLPWPGAYDRDFARRVAKNPATLASLYRGSPYADDGTIIKADWIQRHRGAAPKCEPYVMAMDASYKDSKTADSTAIVVVGRKGSDLDVVDAVRQCCDFPKAIALARSMRQKWPVAKVLRFSVRSSPAARSTSATRPAVERWNSPDAAVEAHASPSRCRARRKRRRWAGRRRPAPTGSTSERTRT